MSAPSREGISPCVEIIASRAALAVSLKMASCSTPTASAELTRVNTAFGDSFRSSSAALPNINPSVTR